MAKQLPPVVTADWLADHQAARRGSSDGTNPGEPGEADAGADAGADAMPTTTVEPVVVVHVGTTMTGHDPRQAYLDRHLPDARYVSLDDDLAGAPAPVAGRHPLPSPEAFASVLSRLGIGTDTAVVAYDDRNGPFAARLVWMLRVLGQPAALLDGGVGTWPGPLTSGPVEHATATRTPTPWPSTAVADADEVAEHIERGGIVVDSRDAARFAGEVEPIDMVAGHVPGAINLAFTDNLIEGRWRPVAELRTRFEPLTADPAAIVYCGSGVTACHNALAIEAAGLPRPRVYVASWSGWSTDPDRPIATGRPE